LDVTTAGLFKIGMERLPDLSSLSHEQKDALIHALWAQVQGLRAQVESLAPEVTRLRSRVADSTRREYRGRLESRLDAAIALAPTNRHGLRLRKRYGKLREHLFTFLDHPDVTADNKGSERELRPTATYGEDRRGVGQRGASAAGACAGAGAQRHLAAAVADRAGGGGVHLGGGGARRGADRGGAGGDSSDL
jgi:hypothetical protein